MDTKSVQITSTVQTKRRKSNQSAVSSKTEQSSSTIDYEKLANEILRQQGKLQAQPTNYSESHPLNPPPPQENITVSPLPCTLQTNSPTGGITKQTRSSLSAILFPVLTATFDYRFCDR